MNIEDISFERFRELQIKGYSLDMIFLLIQVRNNVEIENDSAKIHSLLSTMERKGLITSELKITMDGQQLLDFIGTSEGTTKIVKKKVDAEFDSFWSTFPSTDVFEYRGMKFQGSRALKVDKEKCRLKLKSILNEGEYSIDQIVKALEYEIMLKKESSYKGRENKLKYIHNSLTYLNQRDFEAFISLVSRGETVQETQQINNVTDI